MKKSLSLLMAGIILLSGCSAVNAPNITNPVIINQDTKADTFQNSIFTISALSQPTASINKVSLLAAETLLNNTIKVTIKKDPKQRQVIVAGKTHFHDLWARDGMYGAWGALLSERPDITRDSLSAMLDFQFDNGMISRRMGAETTEASIVKKSLGFKKTDKANFKVVDDEKAGAWWTGVKQAMPGKAPDSNMIVTILFGEYIRRTNDLTFLNSYYQKLTKSQAWLKLQLDENGLISQHGFSDWKDTVDRGKLSMYNQALYYKSLLAMSELALKLNKKEESDYYKSLASNLKTTVNQKFWDRINGYYIDSELFSHFSPDGNLFAVAYGLASSEQAAKIFNRCDLLLKNYLVLPAADGAYPAKNYGLPHRLFDLKDYHDKIRWPWQNALYALAAKRNGEQARAEKILNDIAGVVIKDGDFYETYDNNKPVKRAFYESEVGFSQFAGIFLIAKSEIYSN